MSEDEQGNEVPDEPEPGEPEPDDSFDEELDLEPPDDLDETESPLDETESPASHRDGRRRRLEKLVPDLLKRAIERGIEAGLTSLGNAGKPRAERTERGSDTMPPPAGPAAKEPAREHHREFASVPKEIAGYVFSQIDDTKNATVRVVAREVREFLEAADLATELQKALTKLSFEIRTEIRFIPNDAGGVKPEVKAAISPKTRPAGRRPTALASEEAENDD